MGSPLGDLDGDGYDELGVTAWSPQQVTYVLWGSPDALHGAVDKTLLSLGPDQGRIVGTVMSAGDVNGDGRPDVLLVGPGPGQGSEHATRGRVYVYTDICRIPWFRDQDGDGRGDPDASVRGCVAPDGYVGNSEDCNDADALAWTGSEEVCDRSDNDCDGVVDPDSSSGVARWLSDGDSDGFPLAGDPVVACQPPEGYVSAELPLDCDDGDPAIHPGAEDSSRDGVDQDCNGRGSGCTTTGSTPWIAWPWVLLLLVPRRVRAGQP